MPKPPTKPGESSAVRPDLKIARKIAEKTEAHTLLAMQRAEDPHESVRREFALTRCLDRFIDDELVPRFRRITGVQVNRSTVLRGILRALMERWLIEPPDRPPEGLAESDRLVIEAIESVLGLNGPYQIEASPGSQPTPRPRPSTPKADVD
ncbi:MAG: hypothetical protein ACF8MF_04905 [Phycisphaerales bacterium JB052]